MKDNNDCCYQQMSPISNYFQHAEDSTQIKDGAAYQNSYEMNRPGSDGLDQSGMKK